MKLLKYIFIVACLYIYIYSPPLKMLPFGLIQVMTPVAYVYLAVNRLFGKMFRLYRKEIGIFLILCIYSFIREVLASSDLSFFYDSLFMLVDVIPIAFFISHFAFFNFSSSGIEGMQGKLLNLFVYTAVIAGLITFYLILNPTMAEVMNKGILRSGEVEYESTYRSFGFASSLLFAYAIVQGLAVAILLFKVEKQSIKTYPALILMIVLLVISILFNARIGFAPIAVMTVYLLIMKRSYKLIIACAVLLPLLSYLLFNSSLSYLFGENLDWSLKFFTETQQLLSNKSTSDASNYDVLFNDMLFMPDTAGSIIFGIGQDIIIHAKRNSDIGYVRQLFFGGMIYLSILFYLITSMFLRLRKIRFARWFNFLFIFTTLVCEIKGIMLSNNSAFRTLILLYVGIIYLDAIRKGRNSVAKKKESFNARNLGNVESVVDSGSIQPVAN
ncbi:MAG TPA: hypothetical protein VHB54_08950 [Mucilaginibacter sp.]|nr:hypothetical protein [Mucilaginibacter sp.]